MHKDLGPNNTVDGINIFNVGLNLKIPHSCMIMIMIATSYDMFWQLNPLVRK